MPYDSLAVPRAAELDLFAACLPGLEPLLALEIAELGLSDVQPERGGVAARGDRRAVYAINLWSGLASHVLVRIASFHARRLAELRRKAGNLAWRDWLSPDPPCVVRAACRRSKLYHTGAVVERVAGAIAEATGSAPVADAAELPASVPVVSVRLFEDRCTISLDSSGEPLHRRGYRHDGAKAPLREDLAHALLVASGWDRRTPLVDPMMGSGTLVIEGAGRARRLPPGRGREFAFASTALFDAVLWQEVRGAALAGCLDAAPASIVGSDRDAGAVAACRANAERAGVFADLELSVAPLSAAPGLIGATARAPGGALVSNPPHGRRVGVARRLVPLYQTLGRLAAALPHGWRVALLAADRRLALRTGLRLRTAFLTTHGGMRVRALTGEVGGDAPTRGAF